MISYINVLGKFKHQLLCLLDQSCKRLLGLTYLFIEFVYLLFDRSSFASFRSKVCVENVNENRYGFCVFYTVHQWVKDILFLCFTNCLAIPTFIFLHSRLFANALLIFIWFRLIQLCKLYIYLNKNNYIVMLFILHTHSLAIVIDAKILTSRLRSFWEYITLIWSLS